MLHKIYLKIKVLVNSGLFRKVLIDVRKQKRNYLPPLYHIEDEFSYFKILRKSYKVTVTSRPWFSLI